MGKKPTADRGYTRLKASGKDGWAGEESAYADFKKAIARSFGRSDAPASGRLLELGCGAGNLTLWFASMGYEAYGVDITPTAIDWAKEKNAAAPAKVDFRVEDVAELPSFADGFFDLVIDGHCLHWIAGEDRAKVFATVRRVLRIGGFFLVSSQCGDPPKHKLEQKAKEGLTYDPVRRVMINKCGVVGAYFGTPQSIIEEVRCAGLRVFNWEVSSTPEGNDIHVEAIKPAEQEDGQGRWITPLNASLSTEKTGT